MVGYPNFAILGATLAAFVVATLSGSAIARAGFPLPLAERRIGCIDGLRGYLALIVMVHHFIMWLQITKLGGTWGPLSSNLFNQFGAGGVGLFFMTTGLVFYPRIIAGFGACTWRSIYTSRIFRLLPAVALSVALVTLLIMLRTGRRIDLAYPKAAMAWISTRGEPPLLGYTDSGRLNAYVLWSLYFEWIFYIAILPLCALATDVLRLVKQPSWIVPLALLALSTCGALLHHPPQVLKYLPAFAVGMLCYEIQRIPALAQILRTPVSTLAAAGSLLTGMVAFSSPFGFGLPLFGFFFACVACGNDFMGIFRTRGALVLGECSFSIYLLHGLALDIVYVDFAPLIGRLSLSELPALLPGVSFVVVLMTAVCYLLVERPAILLGSQIARRWK